MITLHHCPQTRSMRSLWLLNELGVDFETLVHPFGKNLRDPSYLRLSPAGRVPALEIDGETIFETGAITQYLCERFPEKGLGRPAGDVERAAWLVWVHFSETLSQHIAALTQQHLALYEDSMRSVIVMKLEAARLRKCLEAVEKRLGESGDYLLPSGFSAADISVGHAVYMGKHFVRLDGLPKTAEWCERITARPGFKASLPSEGQTLFYQKDFYPIPEQAISDG